MSTPTLVRGDAAVEQRAGRDLFAFRSTGSVGTLVELAAGEGRLVRGMPICKVGSFHGGGFILDDIELRAVELRYRELRDGGVFVPPVRVDHGISAWDVIGWIENTYTKVLPDPSDGNREKLYMLADWRCHDDEAYAAIKSGKLRNRSAEFGAYETNAGIVYPLALYGVAFVDIPAVEGLGTVKLRTGEPSSVIQLTEGEPETMPETSDPTTEVRPGVTDPTASPPPDAAPVVQPEPGTATEPEDGEDGDETDAGQTPPVPAPVEEPQQDVQLAASSVATFVGVTPEQALRRLGLNAQADALVSERRQVRATRAEERLAIHRGRGVVNRANEAAARALLAHDDDAVRQHAESMLGAATPPVELGERPATTVQESTASERASGMITLDMSDDEAASLWESLSTEQRKPGSPHHQAQAAWYEARKARG